MPMQHNAESSKFTQCVVLLKLTHGASTQISWTLRNTRNAATVTIGSDPSCDWVIHAAGVAGHAMSVALIDGELFLASGADTLARFRGEELPEDWQKVEQSGRIVLGLAQIELSWEEAPEAADAHAERDRVTLPDGESDALGAQTGRPSWVERLSRSSLIDVPTLLGRVDARGNAHFVRYAVLVLVTVLAYQAWLLLLDRI